MFKLATDVQKIIMEFLKPEEIKAIYESCNVSKVMFEELTIHTNIIISCKRIMSDQEIKWFKLKNIKLKLLETCEIYEDGFKYWYKNGEIHRDNDLPAIIHHDGTQYWYKNGERHRDNDLPAIIYSSGTQQWYQNGLKHRDNDLPAIIFFDGRQYWFKDDKIYYP